MHPTVLCRGVREKILMARKNAAVADNAPTEDPSLANLEEGGGNQRQASNGAAPSPNVDQCPHRPGQLPNTRNRIIKCIEPVTNQHARGQ